MFALFRNPLLRLLGRLWWLPTLTLVVAYGLSGERGWHLAKLGVAAYLAAIAGMIGVAWAHGAWAAWRERARRRLSHYRFLCPECLHLGGFHFACGACGKPVEAFIAYTNGAYVNDCRHCHESLDTSDGRGVQAYCEHCQGCCDRAIHHQRQVGVGAVLSHTDFASLCQATGVLAKGSPGKLGYACADNGEQLTYLLNLADLTNADTPIPNAHALRAVSAVWLDGVSDDMKGLAFELGKAADLFINKTKSEEKPAQLVAVYLGRPTPAPELENVLNQFGAVKYGVAATEFVGRTALPEMPSALSIAKG